MRALKPRAARKESIVDPETKKPKSIIKGLGHWRCPACKKSCKVDPRKPQPKVEQTAVPNSSTITPIPSTPEVTNVESQTPMQP
jgi:hypothetical protein